MSEKAKGKMKEAYGAMTGDEGKKAEGRAQQRKAWRLTANSSWKTLARSGKGCGAWPNSPRTPLSP